MENLEMFGSNFKIDDKVLIKELIECPMGELLPEESSGKYFSQKVEFEGQFELLNDEEKFVICYCDNELAISELDISDSKIVVIPDQDRTVLKVLGSNNSEDLTMIFKSNDRLNQDALKNIKKTNKVEIYLLALVFGGFAKEAYKVIELSEVELEKIEF